MSNKNLLNDSKKLIEEIKEQQKQLEIYLADLEALVEKLEFQQIKNVKLTDKDILEISKYTNQKDYKISKYILLVISIILSIFTFFTTVSTIKPNFNYLGYSIYPYKYQNMENVVKKNSVAIIKRINLKEPINLKDNVAFKVSLSDIKIMEVSSINEDNYILESYEQKFEVEKLSKKEILGTLKFSIPLIGYLMLFFKQYLYVLYIILVIFLFTTYILFKKSKQSFLLSE